MVPGVLFWCAEQMPPSPQFAAGRERIIRILCIVLCLGQGCVICPISRQPRSIPCCAYEIRFALHAPSAIAVMIAVWHDAC